MTEPTIIPAPDSIRHEKISPEALRVIRHLQQNDFQAYLAGGGVRDLLLHRHPKDFDIATSAHPNQVRKIFRNCRLIGRRFRLAHIIFHNHIVEVATFRTLVSASEAEPDLSSAGRDAAVEMRADTSPHVPHGAFRAREGLILRDNVFGTAEQDAWRRDFTINGLFYDPEAHQVIDYVGGLPDIERRIIRVIGDPFVRFREDPVRMVRAVRFAAACDCTIEPAADRAILAMCDQLALASPNRMYEEVLKLFASGAAEGVFRHLIRTGLFNVLFADAGVWLRSSEGHAALPRIYHALHQMDVWKKHGQAINPALAWSLAFGPYHEHRAAALIRRGLKLAPALAQATFDQLLGLASRVQVFRSVIRDASLIMAAQPLFETTQGTRADRFRTRHYFGDALVYLKLRVAFTGQHRELLHWWQQRI